MAWPHEKLVRRHVPDQLRAKGETIETRIAEPGEMRGLLTAKLREEFDELLEALAVGANDQIIEEMADVREVLDSLGEQRLFGHVRQSEKREEKGAFTNIVMKLDAPVPMILHCPKCKAQHIDKGIFATTRVHRTHLCASCGHTWCPYDKATVGVATL